jgi:Beta-L-arabinofuranosidase, GH127
MGISSRTSHDARGTTAAAVNAGTVPSGFAGPATTFWQDAAVPAMRAIGHRIDRDRAGQPYFWLDLESDPPALRHQSWDYCDMSGRWVEALALAREMTGETGWTEVEDLLRTFLAGRAGRDGLFYNADEPAFGSIRAADLFCQGRVVHGLLTWWTETGDGTVERQLDQLVGGLARIASWSGGFASFPGSIHRDGRWLDQPDELGRLDPKVAPALPSPGYRTALLPGLVTYGQLAGSRQALDLAVGLARHYVVRSGAVHPDGRYSGHTHSGGVLPTTLGVLRCGLATDRPELVAWARRVFDHTVGAATSFGWLPDGVGFPDDYFWSRYSETCALADFLEIGIVASESGVGDYWDVVERCARNQLLANQILDTTGLLPASVDPDVVAATVGSFACAATPGSAVGWRQGLEGCCLGSGLRALHLAWRHGVDQHGSTVRVNLPITSRTEAADVLSDDPFAGALRVAVRRPCTVDLRVPGMGPDGTPATDSVTVLVNGNPAASARPGTRCLLPDLSAGDEVRVSYPLPERTETVVVAGESWTARWRGRTVVAMDPVGELCPTYQRHHLEGDAPW